MGVEMGACCLSQGVSTSSAVTVARKDGYPSRPPLPGRRGQVSHFVHEPALRVGAPEEPAGDVQRGTCDGSGARVSRRSSQGVLRKSLREICESTRRRYPMAVTDDDGCFDCEKVGVDATQLEAGDAVDDTHATFADVRDTELSLSFPRTHLYVDDDGNPLSVLQRLWRALKCGRSPFPRFTRRAT